MTPVDGRGRDVAAVLEVATMLSRWVGRERRTPFEGRTLTKTQLQALFLLAHGAGPVTPGQLADELGVTAGAVTQLVDGLKRDGLVEVSAHPSDARSRVLHLTVEAQAQVDRFEHATVESLLPRFDGLGDDELHELARLLRLVHGGGR